jgi:hypothetical protein
VAPLARAADLQVKAARRPLRVSDEPGVQYHLLGIGRPVLATVKGPGQLSLGFRVQAPDDGSDGHAHVRVLVDGSELLSLDLQGPGVAKFFGHHGTFPGQRVDRSVRIGEGSHTVSVSADGGAAAVTFKYQREAPNPLAVASLTPAPLAAAPLAPAPLTAAPLEAAPLAPTPAPAPAPTTVTATEPATASAPAPAPATAVEAEPKPETPSRLKTTLPYYLGGGAILVGGGAITAWALGNGAYGSYKSTPEVQSGSPTNRAQILSQANNDAAWATGLGIVSIVALAGAAVVWGFW